MRNTYYLLYAPTVLIELTYSNLYWLAEPVSARSHGAQLPMAMRCAMARAMRYARIQHSACATLPAEHHEHCGGEVASTITVAICMKCTMFSRTVGLRACVHSTYSHRWSLRIGLYVLEIYRYFWSSISMQI